MFDESLTNEIKTILLLAGLSGLLLIFGHKIAGDGGLWAALCLVVIMNIGAYGFSDRILMFLYQARQVGFDEEPTLFGTVAYLSEKAKMPMPQLYIIDELAPNIFATGRTPEYAAIVVTSGLLDLLKKDELASVLAHQLVAIRDKEAFVSAVVASLHGMIVLLVHLLQCACALIIGKPRPHYGVEQKYNLAPLVMSMLAPVSAIVVQVAISRTREFSADEKCLAWCDDVKGLISALRKLERARRTHRWLQVERIPCTAHLFIVNPVQNKQWALFFSTHPPTSERIRRLEQWLG